MRKTKAPIQVSFTTGVLRWKPRVPGTSGDAKLWWNIALSPATYMLGIGCSVYEFRTITRALLWEQSLARTYGIPKALRMYAGLLRVCREAKALLSVNDVARPHALYECDPYPVVYARKRLRAAKARRRV